MKTACNVCANHCMPEEGRTGLCRVRYNRGGQIKSNAYGKVTSVSLDPIEKKPLHYFYPGSRILSLGSYGCSFSCPFCQNYEISMAGEEEILSGALPIRDLSPEFYRMVHGSLEDVKRFIVTAAGKSHVEVTTLVIPGLNDSEEEIEELARWLASIRPDIPLHLNRFFPRYRMTDREATNIETLLRLADTARGYLRFVKVGNC
ncbi:radical SAM protein [uncultured Clostridium sp.]|uniref:radical SAM protein n=1 Tax=uncultured Clostridium sp. TaxID=59620 RepID=UPI0025CD3100|nr:radical SAM protein [uncultured Clostridium sp.]